MKYVMTVRSRPSVNDPVGLKHQRFMTAICKLSVPWGLRTDRWPPASDPGNNYLSVVNLKGVLGGGLKGSLNYRNRTVLTDEAQSDDWLTLEFNPERVDYSALIQSAFEHYV